jgi:hypothetical protein
LEKNILSVSWITKHNPLFDVILWNHKCFIIDKNNKSFDTSVKEQGLFKLVGEEAKAHGMITKSGQDNNALWYQRYGHLNFHYLTLLMEGNIAFCLQDYQN